MPIDLTEAVRFPFQDKQWVNKAIITIVLLFIPIIGWFIIGGFTVRMVRNVVNGVNQLPEYDDWGGDFSRGLMLFIGAIIYNLPIILFSCCGSIVIGDDGLAGLCFRIIGFIYSLAIAPFLMAATARFAMNEDFGVFFNFPERINDVMTHTEEAGALLLNIFVLYIAAAIVIPIGFVLLCIPGLFAIAIFNFVNGHITAQWGRIIGVGGQMSAPGGQAAIY